MKVTPELIKIFNEASWAGASHDADLDTRKGLQAVFDALEPIPAHVTRVRDARQTTWRRTTEDRAVWTTAGRRSVATSATLVRVYGPITWDGGRRDDHA